MKIQKVAGELIFQIIPVMIGVYLGFVASDWSEQNRKRQEAEVLLENLNSEIETNVERINRVLDYHVMLRDSSRYYANPDNPIKKPDFFKGTRVLKLSSSAYDTGLQTGVINELGLDKIESINQLYTLQSDYNEFANLMMSALITKDFSEREEDMRKIARFLSISMTDIVIKETDLLESYNQVKQKLQG